VKRRATMLAAITSFEFFDALAENAGSEAAAEAMALGLARASLSLAES
jgi:hypothetical protein